MFPPSAPGGVSHIDLSALSGISGSISIACWVVVFSPQIIENFRRQSADGLSVTFLVIWLLGDLFNILGAILQGVLPTMIILAVYYTLADIVLLIQVWYYRGFTFHDQVNKSDQNGTTVTPDNERRPLLHQNGNTNHGSTNTNQHLEPHSVRPHTGSQERSGSFSAIRRHLSEDGTHLSPATPLLEAPKPNDPPAAVINIKKLSTLQSFFFNTFAILLVCAAGVLGWWISTRSTTTTSPIYTPDPHPKPKQPPTQPGHKNEKIEEILKFDILGQVFGYLCAIFYLGSRIPQLLLNYRRKSTEGVSLLFFLFACLGNLTYDMSIFAYDPSKHCAAGPLACKQNEASSIYARYIAVNASWIAGSLGTLVLDFAIFVQFFLYRKDGDGDDDASFSSDHDHHYDDEIAVSG